MLVGLEQLQVSCTFGSRPAENDGDIVDDTRLAQFLQALLVILNVHHAQDNTERVLALQVLDSRVNVLGMEAMILQAQEEGTRRHPEDIIGWYIAVFPGQRLDLFQERIALLSWRDNYGGWTRSSGQCLRLWLLHSRLGSRRGATLSVHALLLSDRCYMLMWMWMLMLTRA